MHCPILLRITVLNNEQHNQNKPKNATRNFRNLSKHNTCKKREIKPKKEKLKVDFPKKKNSYQVVIKNPNLENQKPKFGKPDMGNMKI